jgi:hypothetical protein
MSSDTTIAIAVGLGGGALLWHLTRDKRPPHAAPAAAPSTRSTEPPRTAGPCSLKLDAAGLTVDGTKTDVAAAVERCKANGSAALVLANDAPAAVHVQLASALTAAGVPFTLKVV